MVGYEISLVPCSHFQHSFPLCSQGYAVKSCFLSVSEGLGCAKRKAAFIEAKVKYGGDPLWVILLDF